MLKHIPSKDSWKDANTIYTNFVQEGNQVVGAMTGANYKTSALQSVKPSVSPNKYQK
jgi:CRISPR/Cas system endoribonuclease Cas6 (RAMP superfamily)